MSNASDFQQHQQLALENDPELKQQLQQNSNARIIKAVAAQHQQQPPTNFVYNVESGDKNAPPVQLLFQLPPHMAQHQAQQQQGVGEPLTEQQQQQLHAEQAHLFQHRTGGQRPPTQSELEQVAQELLLQRSGQVPAGAPVVGVQAIPLKQKHFNLHPPPCPPTCVQHQVCSYISRESSEVLCAIHYILGGHADASCFCCSAAACCRIYTIRSSGLSATANATKRALHLADGHAYSRAQQRCKLDQVDARRHCQKGH